MTSTKLELESIRISSAPVENSRLSSPGRETVSVCVRQGQIVGLGEACPLPGYGPERIEDAIRALTTASTFPVPTFRAPEEIFEWVDGHVSEHNPAARFALETALLDVLAQERRCPLWALFVERNLAKTTVEHAALLPCEDVLEAASGALERGAVAFKLKVGFAGAASAEVGAVRKLRGAFPRVPLRLDANGAFTTQQWLDFQAQLVGIDFEFIEEPIRREDIPWPHTRHRVALDESLQHRHWTPVVRDWALSPGTCQVFVLKPTTLGGWSRCLELAKAAQGSAIRCVVSHVFGGGIEYAACHHLAVICQQAHTLSAGLGPHPGLLASPYRFDPRGLAHALGLGIESRALENAP